MKASQWVRLVVLAFAVVSVAGVMAVIACGPSAPLAPPNGAGNVSDSVSLLATEAPFLLPQSGDGDGVEVEPTAEPTDTSMPTATVPLDGNLRVGHYLMERYVNAVEENTAREARGEAREFRVFRVLPVFVKTTLDGKGAVAKFLEANGGLNVFINPDALVGRIALDMDIGVIPELLEVEGFIRVDLDIQAVARRDYPYGSGSGGVTHSRRVSKDLDNQYLAVEAEATSTASRGGEEEGFPVVRVVVELRWADHVDYMVEFLKANGGKNIKLTQDSDVSLDRGTVEVDISLGLIREFHYMQPHGVERVERARQGSGPSSSGAGRFLPFRS